MSHGGNSGAEAHLRELLQERMDALCAKAAVDLHP